MVTRTADCDDMLPSMRLYVVDVFIILYVIQVCKLGLRSSSARQEFISLQSTSCVELVSSLF